MSYVAAPELQIVRLTEYQPEIAAGIGRLLVQLDPSFSSEPVPEEVLGPIIDSPDHDQFVALLDSQVVGAASMSVVRGAGFNKRGQLEDFVVDQEMRGQGIGRTIWNSLVSWCEKKDLPGFYLQTETFRPEAIAFYEKVGAEIMGQTVTYQVKNAFNLAA